MTRRIFKWSVPVDDQDHPIGAGPVVNVAPDGRSCVNVWTDEATGRPIARAARAYGTGQPLPDNREHIGSAVAEPFVWHVLAAPIPKEKS